MNDASLIQKTYTAVLRHFMAFGRAPHYTELSGILNLSPEEARQMEHKTAEAALASWFMPETDYVESWAPFSNIPTHYLITVDGEQKWYGQ